MEYTNETYNAVERYFSVLKHTGYKSYNQVDKLLVMTFIEELLRGPLSQFITDKDYKTIVNSQHCLYGTCMIPYPDYKEGVPKLYNSSLDMYRATETSILRGSEDYNLRVMS